MKMLLLGLLPPFLAPAAAASLTPLPASPSDDMFTPFFGHVRTIVLLQQAVESRIDALRKQDGGTAEIEKTIGFHVIAPNMEKLEPFQPDHVTFLSSIGIMGETTLQLHDPRQLHSYLYGAGTPAGEGVGAPHLVRSAGAGEHCGLLKNRLHPELEFEDLLRLELWLPVLRVKALKSLKTELEGAKKIVQQRVDAQCGGGEGEAAFLRLAQAVPGKLHDYFKVYDHDVGMSSLAVEQRRGLVVSKTADKEGERRALRAARTLELDHSKLADYWAATEAGEKVDFSEGRQVLEEVSPKNLVWLNVLLSRSIAEMTGAINEMHKAFGDYLEARRKEWEQRLAEAAGNGASAGEGCVQCMAV